MSRSNMRARVACDACRHKKAKCDGMYPCLRCREARNDDICCYSRRIEMRDQNYSASYVAMLRKQLNLVLSSFKFLTHEIATGKDVAQYVPSEDAPINSILQAIKVSPEYCEVQDTTELLSALDSHGGQSSGDTELESSLDGGSPSSTQSGSPDGTPDSSHASYDSNRSSISVPGPKSVSKRRAQSDSQLELSRPVPKRRAGRQRKTLADGAAIPEIKPSPSRIIQELQPEPPVKNVEASVKPVPQEEKILLTPPWSGATDFQHPLDKELMQKATNAYTLDATFLDTSDIMVATHDHPNCQVADLYDHQQSYGFFAFDSGFE